MANSAFNEDLFFILLEKKGLPLPKPEFKFHPKRRWRFDYAFVDHKLAVEIEGGAYKYGRHNRATGFIKDMEKYNAAAELGWRLLRATPKDAMNWDFIEQIGRTLKK